MPYVGQKPADIISTAVDTVTGTFSGEVDAASLDISGNIDVDGTTNLDVVDIDGAVDMASTLTVNGVTTLNEKFVIDGSANDLMKFRTTGDTASQVLGLQFQNNSEAVTAQIFGTGDNSSSGVFRIKGIGDVAIVGGDIGVTGAAGDLVVKSGGDVHVGTGDLVFATSGKGIVLGATSNTAANTLEDYEEGTFTPNFALGGSGNGLTYGNEAGSYTKVGNRVHTSGIVQLTGKDNAAIGTGAITITGLPFTVTNNNNAYAAAGLRMQNISFADSPSLATVINSTTADLREITNAGTVTTLTDGNIASNSYVIFSLSYQTDA